MSRDRSNRSRSGAPRLPDDVRLALRRYFPTEMSARVAAYYALPEYLALLRLRSEAESRLLRWTDVAEDLRKELNDLDIRVTECTAFTNSYELEVLLHEGEDFSESDEELAARIKPPIRTARITASFLLPYWTIAFRKTRRERDGRLATEQVPQQGQHTTRVVNAATKVLRKHGWKRISSNLAQTKIPGIDLEYIDQGEVRVLDVVFGDLHAL